jgi:hypothetical protein
MLWGHPRLSVVVIRGHADQEMAANTGVISNKMDKGTSKETYQSRASWWWHGLICYFPWTQGCQGRFYHRFFRRHLREKVRRQNMGVMMQDNPTSIVGGGLWGPADISSDWVRSRLPCMPWAMELDPRHHPSWQRQTLVSYAPCGRNDNRMRLQKQICWNLGMNLQTQKWSR